MNATTNAKILLHQTNSGTEFFTNKISVSSSGADAIVSTLLNLLAYSLFHNSLSIFGINEIAGNHGTIVVKLTLGF